MTLPDAAWPLDGGKRLRVESLLRAVSATCDVDAVVLGGGGSPDERPFPPDLPVDHWARLPQALVPREQAVRNALRAGLPWRVAVQDWDAVRAAVAGWPGPYDVLWLGGLDHAAGLHRLVTARGTVVDVDDVETVKLRAFLATRRSAGEARHHRAQRRVELPLWRRLQRQVLRDANAVLVCSALDRDRLATETGGERDRIHVVPNTYRGPVAPVTAAPPPPPVCTVVVIANYRYGPNVDAAAFAAASVLPLLRERVPGSLLRLVGRHAELLDGLTGIDGLVLVGPVTEVGPELAGATCVLVPVRYGGGTRLKILEAFAHGVPVVSTTAGAEGLDVVDDEHLLMADRPEQLVAAVARVHGDGDLRARLIAAARSLWQERYSPDAAGRAVDGVLEAVLGGP